MPHFHACRALPTAVPSMWNYLTVSTIDAISPNRSLVQWACIVHPIQAARFRKLEAVAPALLQQWERLAARPSCQQSDPGTPAYGDLPTGVCSASSGHTHHSPFQRRGRMMGGRIVTLLIALWLVVGPPNGALAQDRESGSMGVWVARVDGSEPTLIAPGAFTPDWSPDGQQISSAASSPEGMGLFVSAPDGTATTPILSDPALWPLASRWSPDGSLIAFSGGEGR